MSKKAIIFDRDGVLNRLIEREDGRLTAPWTFDEFISNLLPNVKEAVELAHSHGFLAFVATNQPHVLSGKMVFAELDLMLSYLEDECGFDFCRASLLKDGPEYKPNPGMFNRFIKEYELEVKDCLTIGDRASDIVASNRAGINHTVMIDTSKAFQRYVGDPYEDGIQPTFYAPDVLSAVEFICKWTRK